MNSEMTIFFFFLLIYCPRGLSPIIDVKNVVYYYSEAPVPVSSLLQLPHPPHEADVLHPMWSLPNGVQHGNVVFWDMLQYIACVYRKYLFFVIVDLSW